MRIVRTATSIVCGIVLLAALPARAEDLTIAFKTTSGKQASTSTQYLTAARMRTADAEQDSIVDFAAGRIIQIDHKKKQYSEMTMDQIEAAMQEAAAEMQDAQAEMQEAMKDMPPALREKMGGMMGGGAAAVTVAKGSTRKVAGYECQVYTLSMGSGISMEMCNTTALALPMKPGEFARVGRFASSFAANPMFQQMSKLGEEMKKIEGFTLADRTRTSMMGRTIESSREAVEVKAGPIPDSVFEIPAGYKKVDSPMKAMGPRSKR